MNPTELRSILQFLKNTEKLKSTLRSGFTSEGRKESVAEHSWRLSLLATIFHNKYFPHLDFERLLKICLIHDLGEIVNGDIPAPSQAGRPSKSDQEREDFITILDPLPDELKDEYLMLWDEYENITSEEAKLAKALDKLETIMQHNLGKNPADFDYEFNLAYGQQHTGYHEVISAFRQIIDKETENRAMNQ